MTQSKNKNNVENNKNSSAQNLNLTSLKFDLINNCNYRCSFCPYYGEGEGKGRVISSEGIRQEPIQAIDLELLTSMFEELSQTNLFPAIKISGWGEGLLHPNFDQIVQNAHGLGFKIRMISNGYLTEHHLESILQNLDAYVVSIHGPPQIHNKIVKVKNAYEKTMAGITKLLEASTGVENSLSEVILTFTIAPNNFLHLTEQAHLVKELQHKSRKIPIQARFQHDYFPSTNYEATNETYNLASLEQELTEVKKLLPQVKIIPELAGSLLEAYYAKTPFILNPHKCDRVAHELEIRSNGDVYTCKSDLFGNLYQQSILDILHGPKWKKFVDSVQKEAQSSNGLSSGCDRCCYQADYVLPMNKR